jgi:hypothetical protein
MNGPIFVPIALKNFYKAFYAFMGFKAVILALKI